MLSRRSCTSINRGNRSTKQVYFQQVIIQESNFKSLKNLVSDKLQYQELDIMEDINLGYFYIEDIQNIEKVSYQNITRQDYFKQVIQKFKQQFTSQKKYRFSLVKKALISNSYIQKNVVKIQRTFSNVEQKNKHQMNLLNRMNSLQPKNKMKPLNQETIDKFVFYPLKFTVLYQDHFLQNWQLLDSQIQLSKNEIVQIKFQFRCDQIYDVRFQIELKGRFQILNYFQKYQYNFLSILLAKLFKKQNLQEEYQKEWDLKLKDIQQQVQSKKRYRLIKNKMDFSQMCKLIFNLKFLIQNFLVVSRNHVGKYVKIQLLELEDQLSTQDRMNYIQSCKKYQKFKKSMKQQIYRQNRLIVDNISDMKYKKGFTKIIDNHFEFQESYKFFQKFHILNLTQQQKLFQKPSFLKRKSIGDYDTNTTEEFVHKLKKNNNTLNVKELVKDIRKNQKKTQKMQKVEAFDNLNFESILIKSQDLFYQNFFNSQVVFNQLIKCKNSYYNLVILIINSEHINEHYNISNRKFPQNLNFEFQMLERSKQQMKHDDDEKIINIYDFFSNYLKSDCGQVDDQILKFISKGYFTIDQKKTISERFKNLLVIDSFLYSFAFRLTSLKLRRQISKKRKGKSKQTTIIQQDEIYESYQPSQRMDLQEQINQNQQELLKVLMIKIKYQNQLYKVKIKFSSCMSFIEMTIYNPFLQSIQYERIVDAEQIQQILDIIDQTQTRMRSLVLNYQFKQTKSISGNYFKYCPKNKDNCFAFESQQKSISVNNLLGLKLTSLCNIQNNFFMKYFVQSSFWIIYNIKSIGKLYIDVNKFQNNKKLNFSEHQFFLLKIYPFETKCRCFKFIFTIQDFMQYFSSGLMNTELNNYNFIKTMKKKLICNIKFIKGKLYRKLSIPIECTLNNNGLSEQYHLKMNVQRYSYEEQTDITSFIKPKYINFRFIVSQVKKINNNFIIFTIYKNIQFGYWNIEIYLVKVNRYYYAKLNKIDLYRFRDDFLSEIFPNYIRQMENKLSKLSYHQFIRKLIQIKKMNQINIIKNSSYIKVNSQNNFINLDLLIKSLVKNEKQNDFYELYFFMQLIDKIRIIGSKYFFQFKFTIDNYNGFLKNLIMHKTISLNDYQDDLFIEMTFLRTDNKKRRFLFTEKHRKIESLLVQKPHFHKEEFNKYQFYLKAKLLNINMTNIFKINLADAFYTYQFEHLGLTDEQIQKIDRIQYEQVFKISEYLVYKIERDKKVYINKFIDKMIANTYKQNQFYINDFTPKEIFNQSYFKKKDKFIDIKKLILKFKELTPIYFRINQQIEQKYLTQIKQKKKILIYRQILSLRPRIMATISYCNYLNQFIIYQTNFKNGYSIKRLIHINIVKNFIPHADFFLHSKQYYHLGVRMIKHFINNFIFANQRVKELHYNKRNIRLQQNKE